MLINYLDRGYFKQIYIISILVIIFSIICAFKVTFLFLFLAGFYIEQTYKFLIKYKNKLYISITDDDILIDDKYIFRSKNTKNHIKFKDIVSVNKQDNIIEIFTNENSYCVYLKALSIESEKYLINILKSFC
ncbi:MULTISPECIES: hypothetical protein [unclassified Clostridioides]|uniref:hypothetical protein n=1 Tax=unclassified Clostridioides TaxID=2635829 RepID=UPI001D11F4B1